MVRNFILSFALLFIAFQSYSQQSRVIRGSVTDKKSGEPVAYANIGIEGTYYGAASNVEGFFEFKIPADLTSGLLFASAVGYQGFRIDLQNLAQESLKIEIEPTAYDIGVIDVSANSLVLFKAIKDAIDALDRNYPQKALAMTAYYKNEHTADNQPPRVDEAIVEISDATGYQRENPAKEQLNRNYRIRESRRNFKIQSLSDGTNRLDNLLNCDIVRTRRNILDKAFLKEYDLSSDVTTSYEGIPVWVINYSLNNPSFDRTGIYHVQSYKGKLYISKNDHAILKNELWIRSVDPSTQGWTIASPPETTAAKATAEHEITTTYKKINGKYLPAYIKSVSRTLLRDPLTGTDKTTENESYLIPTNTNTTNPELLKSRDYYSEKPFNKSFWDSFNIAIE